MNLFNISYKSLVKLLLPVSWRDATTVAWLYSLVKPVRSRYALFTTSRNANLYDLRHTSQVVYMEAALNDRWDFTLRRIVIEDAPSKDTIYIYLQAEQKPVFIYTAAEQKPVYLYLESETIAGDDFIVLVPSDIVFDINEMKALINKYKLPSKKYKIAIV